MSDISDLQLKIRQFCDQRDWDQFHNPKDMAISLVLEATEVLEHFQWKNAESTKEHLENNKDAVAEELSDTLYWVLRMADKLGIDLQMAFEKKMVKNAEKYPVEKSKGTSKKYSELQ